MNKVCNIGNIINKRKNNFSGTMMNHLRSVLGQWSTMEIGDCMDKDIVKCINLILDEDFCKEVVYFNEDEEDKLWIILEEDDFDTNMKISDIIEDCLAFNGIDLDYCFFDEDEKDEIENQLSLTNISARRFNKDGR